MPQYRRKQFEPSSKEPFKISRSKIDLFMECRRCAYLELRFGVRRPDGPSFTLNNAVDELLKREFDMHRAKGTVHPLAKEYGVLAVPFDDPRLEEWRDALRRGIQTHHRASNFIVRGGIDDVWKDERGALAIVDYKATSKKEGPKTEDDLYPSYKRQIEVYQWLFRQNNFDVSSIGYFVYVNGRSDAKAFDGKLEFDVSLIPYKGDDSWIESTLLAMRDTLSDEKIPEMGTSFGGGPCDFCTYREAAGKALQSQYASTKSRSARSTPRSLFE